MTTLAERADDMLELNLQPVGATGVYFYRRMLLHLDVAARNVFAVATPCTAIGYLEHRGGGGARAAADAPQETAGRPAGTDLVDAIGDLRDWLHVSYDELAKLLGWHSASNLHHWRRAARRGEPVRPRAASVEPILRLHALLRAVAETVSGDGPGAVHLWSRTPLRAGGPTPLQLLAQGRLDEVERLAAPLLFDRTPAGAPEWRVVQAERDDDLPPQGKDVSYTARDFG